jgi:RHS repeat-associated protein
VAYRGAGSADVPGGQFGFGGGYKTTAGPYHYGQRYYDPTLMRWTQPDPLDQTGDLREGNRYVYGAGDPVNKVDPQGMLAGTAPGNKMRRRTESRECYKAKFEMGFQIVSFAGGGAIFSSARVMVGAAAGVGGGLVGVGDVIVEC